MKAAPHRQRRPVRVIAFVALAFPSLAVALGCQPRSTPELPSRGGQAYLAQCAACHGVHGGGDGPVSDWVAAQRQLAPPALNDPRRMRRLGAAGTVTALWMGGSEPHGRGAMPIWGPHLGHDLGAAITGYVLGLPEEGSARKQAADRYLRFHEGREAPGRRSYVLYCSSCHGPWGQGDGFFSPQLARTLRPPALADSARLAARTDAELAELLALGGGHAPRAPTMPGWLGTLDQETIRSLVSYLRVLSRTPPR